MNAKAKHNYRPGTRFGRRVVLGDAPKPGKDGHLHRLYVKCDCGDVSAASGLSIAKSFECKRCAVRRRYDCDNIPISDEARKVWLNRRYAMISRCHNRKDPKWPSYGGRGISVYWEWKHDSRSFLRYVTTLEDYERAAFDPDWTIDRKDNDGNYEPGNVRLVTRKVNMQNRPQLGSRKRASP